MQQFAVMAHSIVEWFDKDSDNLTGHRCGYCKQSDTNISEGLWAHTLTVQDYQDMIDRGWRRSGKYCYKPAMNKTCCPQYPIRLDVNKFTLRKSHKKVIKAVNRYLNTGQKRGESLAADASMKTDEGAVCSTTIKHSQDNESSTAKAVNPGVGADPSKPKCVKAKVLRQQRRLERLQKQNETSPTLKPPGDTAKPVENNQAKSLEELLDEVSENPAHSLELRLVRSTPPSEEFNSSFDESFLVYKRYQKAIHKDPEEKLTEHKYRRFLVDSPLQEEEESSSAYEPGYGSFHLQYILDGRIIAVGVIDILPSCISSVYLYYDPDYDFLSLGTYSALKETAFTKSIHTTLPDMQYYYMGYYIHSCPKMKYKGNYDPSYLNCPETYDWYPYQQCAAKLDANKYSRFAPPGKEDKHEGGTHNDVLVLYKRIAMPYALYQQRSKARDSHTVTRYAQLIGKHVAGRMLLYRA